MKKIIIIVAALLLLGGGGFAVWKMFFAGAKSETAAAEGQGEHGEKTGPIFMDLEPFIVPVIRENRVVKYLSLSIKIELTGPAAEAKVKEMMPYLRDAYLTRLHTALSRGDPAQGYDAAKLKRQLMAESDKVLGEGLVHDVLIGAVLEKNNP
ncbi:MAG TPA: flagellar basal body-associated FliL family protein [Alphaproteobacteria bacterium]|jgi:flagellar FliL protein|nr:flagellar basal body-associated FliL family protein [Alphaproteobacteria bacterium]